MATSGTVTFNLDRDEIIKDALVDIGAIASEDTPPAAIVNHASRKLNMLLKAWQADGLQLWLNKEVVLFLDGTKQYYKLGPSGDHAVLRTDYNKTEVKVAAVATDTSIDVDTTSGMSVSDYIGIVLDDGTIHWSTVSSITDSDTVVIADALATGATAAVDNNVYWYTTKINRPLRITDAVVRNDSEEDLWVTVFSRNEYFEMSGKSTTGQITNVYYDPQRTSGNLYTYPTTDSVTDRLVLRCQMPIEDMTTATDNIDCPQEWLLAIQLKLAVLLSPSYGNLGTSEFQHLKGLAKEEKDTAMGFDVEGTSLKLQPNKKEM